MSNIRKEYKEYKQITKELWEADVLSWTEQNVILINERLNRNAIHRLNSAINRFDNKFGPYRDKLPAIAEILSNAENGLYQVVTGNVSPRAAAKMLQRLSIIYNILSNFFGGDLGALLKTPSFRIANEKSDEKIDKIIDQGHDIGAIRKSMAAALKPDENERKIFRKAYKTFEMPNLDWNAAAKQLCCLSCNELKDLAGIPTVPMVVVDKNISSDKSDVGGEGLDEQSLGAMYYGAQAANAIGSGLSAAGSAIGTAAGAAGNFLAGAAGAAGISAPVVAGAAVLGGTGYLIYKKFKNVTDQMAAALANLQKLVSTLDGFENINTALGKLRSAALSASSGMKSDKSLQGIRGWMRHPTLTILKQIERVISAFKSVTEVWNKQIKTLYAGKGFRAEDIPKIKEIFEKAIKGGYLKRGWKFITGVREFPGLTEQEIVNAFVDLAKRGVISEEPPGRAEESGKAETATGTSESILREARIIEKNNNISMLFEEMHDISEAVLLSEDYQDLERFVAQFVAWDNSNKADDEAKKAIENLNKVAATAKGNSPPDPRLTNQLFGGPSGGAQAGMMPGMMPVMPVMMGGRMAGGAQSQTAVPYPATPAAGPQAVANVKAEADREGTADPGFDPEDIGNLQNSISVIESKANDPLDKSILEDLNRQIGSYGVQQIRDYRSALTYLQQYQNFLTRANDYNTVVASIINAINAPTTPTVTNTAPSASGPAMVAEAYRRQQLVNKVKKLILNEMFEDNEESRRIIEQMMREEEVSESERAAAMAVPPATTAVPAARATTPAPATTVTPPTAEPPAAPAAQPAAPAPVDPNAAAAAPPAPAAPGANSTVELIDEVTNASPIDQKQMNIFKAAVGKFRKPAADQGAADLQKQLATKIDNYIKRKNLGVNNLQEFEKTMDLYQNIVSNSQNVKKIIILINKTANLISKKQPKKAGSSGSAKAAPAAGRDAGAGGEAVAAPKTSGV